MDIIRLEKLNFNYRNGKVSVPIFSGLDLSVKRGEFVAIKGPSGSGKSTLLYLIAGLLKFDAGTIYVDGKDVQKLSDLELSRLRNHQMGFVFQQFHLLPRASVLDNILMPTFYPIEDQKPPGSSKEKAIEIATQLGIGDRLDHAPNQLSGGQQQRVAVARALINDPDIILADEPTGNLDSKSTDQIIRILKDLNQQGKTIILITHEEDVAQAASKIFYLKDGMIVEQKEKDHSPAATGSFHENKRRNGVPDASPARRWRKILPLAVSNAFLNKARSLLTMVGITVGVAAVCSMVTLGSYTKEKIIDSYAELGVNTLLFRGYPNWRLKATDRVPVMFRFFDWQNDVLPLRKILPDIQLLSPSMTTWSASASFAGRMIEKEAHLVGVSEDGLKIVERRLIAGKNMNRYHVARKNSVCVIGYEIGQRLFANVSPLGQIIHISLDSSTFVCKVIGVLESKSSNKEWAKPNLEIYIPFTVFQAVSENWWRSNITEVMLKIRQGADVEKVGRAIRTFFEKKYGKSGNFRADSDSILVAQMKKFLNLFSILLAAIALVTLTVGGMGIANMMLVSVSERLKEIGLRKAVGATHASIRTQFLCESVVLCGIAGVLGILLGIGAYQGAIYGASRLIPKFQYEWVIDPAAILFSIASILLVGILSGLAPAVKAQKLQVIDALRTE